MHKHFRVQLMHIVASNIEQITEVEMSQEGLRVLSEV